MSFLSALFKPLKKIVKKIGKKVKKVFKKIGKAIGKLGIVGQIGMMFLMPYAAGALGSFFGTAGTLSKWGATLLSKGGIASKALGHTLNAINTVGTTIGKVYTGVTDTISNAFDTVMKKGTQFLEKTGFKTPGASTPTDALTDLSSAVESGQAIDPSLRSPVDTNLMRIKPAENVNNVLNNYQKDFAERFGPANKTITEIISTTAEESLLGSPSVKPPVEQGIFEKVKEFGKEVMGDIEDKAVAEVKGRVKETATEKVMESLGLQEPEQGSEYGTYDPAAAVAQIQRTDSGINFTNSFAIDTFARQGNNHLAYGLANTGHVASIFDPQNNPTTNQFMTSYYIAPNVSRQLGVA
jgi:hypothetical protein